MFTGLVSEAQSQAHQMQKPPVKTSSDAGEPKKNLVAPKGYAWIGTWISNHYAGGYVGGLKSLGDSDLWQDSFLLRIDGSGGQYSYLSSGQTLQSALYDASLLIGYRKIIDRSSISIFIGPSFEQHSRTEVNAALRGFEAGARIIGDYSYKHSADLEFAVQLSYATPFRVYSGNARVLYQVMDRLWLGPQIAIYGNRAPYQEGSLGIVAKYETSFGELGISTGYRQTFKTSVGTPSGKEGYFLSAFFALPF